MNLINKIFFLFILLISCKDKENKYAVVQKKNNLKIIENEKESVVIDLSQYKNSSEKYKRWEYLIDSSNKIMYLNIYDSVLYSIDLNNKNILGITSLSKLRLRDLNYFKIEKFGIIRVSRKRIDYYSR
jgi:hypothetical protein